MQTICLPFSLPPSSTWLKCRSNLSLSRNSLSVPVSSLSHTLDNHHMTVKLRCENVEATRVDMLDQEYFLETGLQVEAMPKHLAVISDGHRRWARKNGLPSKFGHRRFVPRHKQLARLCCKCGIKVLTAFVSSPANYKRPKDEVESMMNLIEEGLRSNLEESMWHDIRISIIGDRRGLSKSCIEVISEAEEKTKANTRLHVILAINYGGQSEILEACKRLCRKVKDGSIEEEEINHKIFEQELWTNICPEFPFPDMLIRFAGEQRLSDFLAYQLAYAELYFSKTLFPEFGEKDFIMAMKYFQERQRRFGGGK